MGALKVTEHEKHFKKLIELLEEKIKEKNKEINELVSQINQVKHILGEETKR